MRAFFDQRTAQNKNDGKEENAAFMTRADMLEISLHFLKQSQGNFHEEKQVTRLAIRWNMRVTVYQIWLDSGWSVQTQEGVR